MIPQNIELHRPQGGIPKTDNPPYVLKSYGGLFMSIIQFCRRKMKRPRTHNTPGRRVMDCKAFIYRTNLVVGFQLFGLLAIQGEFLYACVKEINPLRQTGSSLRKEKMTAKSSPEKPGCFNVLKEDHTSAGAAGSSLSAEGSALSGAAVASGVAVAAGCLSAENLPNSRSTLSAGRLIPSLVASK